MKTTLRKELIEVLELMTRRFPQYLQNYNYLDELKDENVKRIFPLNYFIVDLLDKIDFVLTDESIEHNLSVESENTERYYDYIGETYSDVLVSIVSNPASKSKKGYVSVRPDGKKFDNDYTLWVDGEDEEMVEEFTTKCEYVFCKYLLKRCAIVDLVNQYGFETATIGSFADMECFNWLLDCDKSLKNFSLYIYNEKDDNWSFVYETKNVNDIERVLSAIDINRLWKSDYKSYQANKLWNKLGISK